MEPIHGVALPESVATSSSSTKEEQIGDKMESRFQSRGLEEYKKSITQNEERIRQLLGGRNLPKRTTAPTIEENGENRRYQYRTQVGHERNVVNQESEIQRDDNLHTDKVFDSFDDSMSVVSALTFEYSNLGNLGPVDAPTVSPPPIGALMKEPGTTTVSPLIRNRSKRLSNVHEKVLTIQKENKNLKEANLRLMLQISTNNRQKQNGKGTTPDEETTKRLHIIIDKVQEVQKENLGLKIENTELREMVNSMQLQNSALLGPSSSCDTTGIGINYSLEVNAGLYSTAHEQNKNLNRVATPRNELFSPETTPQQNNIIRNPADGRNFNFNKMSSTDETASEPAPTPSSTQSLQDMTMEELERQKKECALLKKQLENQLEMWQRLMKRDLFCENCDAQIDANGLSSSSRTSTPLAKGEQNNKENLKSKKKRRGLLMSRKNKQDRKIEELTQKVSDLENRLQKSKKARSEDLEKIAEFGLENIKQRTEIMSLERRIKQNKSTMDNLEHQLNNAKNEIMDLKDMHSIEKEELQIEYDELKDETSGLVNWLKQQLASYQGKSAYGDENTTSEKGESDMESLTKSERDALSREIEEERKNWMEFTDTPEVLAGILKLKAVAKGGNESIGASTLTTRSPI